MVEGQKILSPTSASTEGMRVSAASSATRIPNARQIPMVETMLKEQMDMAPNPMMTDAPETAMDSPAQTTAWWRASSWDLPERSSSLYLAIMKIQ